MGAGATVAAHLAAEAMEDIDAISVTAVEAAPETVPSGSIAISSNVGLRTAFIGRNFHSTTIHHTVNFPAKTALFVNTLGPL